MVDPPSLCCLGTFLLVALMVLVVSLAHEPKPDIHEQISSIRGQARHAAHRVSEKFLDSAIELLNEKRKPR